MSIFWIQKVKFAIKDVKASVDNVVISTAMDSVITNNVFTAKKSLNSDKNWGTWDMFSGDMISSIAKHNKINDAERSFSRIASLIASFNNELLDVKSEGINFSNTTIAFDIFFYNIFTDWAVQNKINDAINKVAILKRRVKEILYGLDKQNETLKTVIENKRREYEILIENI